MVHLDLTLRNGVENVALPEFKTDMNSARTYGYDKEAQI